MFPAVYRKRPALQDSEQRCHQYAVLLDTVDRGSPLWASSFPFGVLSCPAMGHCLGFLPLDASLAPAGLLVSRATVVEEGEVTLSYRPRLAVRAKIYN